MSMQQNRSKTPLSSILQASKNSNASGANILKLTQENIINTIPNATDFKRRPNSAKNSEYSIPMYDTMSVASTRSRTKSSHTSEKNNTNDDDDVSVLSFNSSYSTKQINNETSNETNEAEKMKKNDDDDDNISVISFQSNFSEYTNHDNKTITKDILENSKKSISNLPTDIYKILKTFHNTKDDVKYRSKFQIPSEFNVYYYLLRYPRFGNIYDYNYKKVVGLYKHYFEVGKQTHPMDDKYYRIRYSIPDIFDYETYYKRYEAQLKNIRLKHDNVSVYRYYYRHGFRSFPLDTYYLRLYMKIHKYFDIQILFQRYNELKDFEETFNTNNEIEIYNFYNSINKDKFCLDDQYFRLFFHIPDDFKIKCYRKRYNHISEIVSLEKQEDCETYAYFEKSGKNNYPLDEKYYFILNSVSRYFDTIIYKKRYNENFQTNDSYEKITNFYSQHLDSHPLDEQYFGMKYNIQDDFNWKKYGEAFSQYFDNIEDARNMGKMYELYHKKFHEKYEKKIYDHYLILKNDLSSVNKELYNKLYLFMFEHVDDETFNRFSDWKLTYSNIYGAMLNATTKDDFIFRKKMSLLLRKCNFSSERDYRAYIRVSDFCELEEYYQPMTTKHIKQVTKYYTENELVEKRPVYRRRMVAKKSEELTEEEKGGKIDPNEDKNRLAELLKKYNKDEPQPNHVPTNKANNISAPNFAALGSLNLGKVISTLRDKRNKKNNTNEEQNKIELQTQPQSEPEPQQLIQQVNINSNNSNNSKSKVNDLLEKITKGMSEGADLQTIAQELKQK